MGHDPENSRGTVIKHRGDEQGKTWLAPDGKKYFNSYDYYAAQGRRPVAMITYYYGMDYCDLCYTYEEAKSLYELLIKNAEYSNVKLTYI